MLLSIHRTVSKTKPESRSAHSLPLRSWFPDSSNAPESRSKITTDVLGKGRIHSNTERDHSSAGSLSSRSGLPHSSSDDSSNSSCSRNSRQRYSAEKIRVMEKFGNNEHKSLLERYYCIEREDNNRIEREEYNRYSLNVTFDMIIT